MTIRIAAAAMGISALLVPAGQALAAEAAKAPIRYVEVESEELTVPGLDLRVEQVRELDIVNARGEVIGEVDEVLSAADGTIVAISTEVGGFLGVGEREVILTLDQIRLQDGRLAIGLTDDQLKNLPQRD